MIPRFFDWLRCELGFHHWRHWYSFYDSHDYCDRCNLRKDAL